MAVFTHLTTEEQNALLAGYDIGGVRTVRAIAEGVENSNFLVEADNGRFILTIYEKRVAAEDLPFFMEVMERLAARGFPAPRPIARRDGAVIASVRGKLAALVSFLTGASVVRPNIAQCGAVGAGLARMHEALADMKDMRANALGPDAWRRLITPRFADAEALRPGLAVLLRRDLDAIEAWPRDLPRGTIHANLFPDNAHFMGDELTGVFDFYFACTDFLAYDLAVNLNAWCFEDAVYNVQKGAAMIAGYQGVRALTEAELASLPLLARGAALRFFATRLVDWIETPADALVTRKDPLEYADKLAFHRGANTAGDYGA